MPREMQLANGALWKRRFLLPLTYGLQIAAKNPARGLASSTRTGVEQLYAWDVATGALRQLTTKLGGAGSDGGGIPNATLSPDGTYVYFLDDTQGSEIGHFKRIPYAREAGKTQEDITPYLPDYAGFALSFSRAGNRLGFTAVHDGLYHVYMLDVALDGALSAPRLLLESDQQTIGPTLTANGILAIIETKLLGASEYHLVALDAATGEQVATLIGDDGGLEYYFCSPVTDDPRCVALSPRTGEYRPLLWNPQTGERIDLALEGIADLEGDIIPMDWSDDGTQLLLIQNAGVRRRLVIYDLATHRARALPEMEGSLGGTEPGDVCFGPKGSIYARWESSTQPPQTIMLDAEAGAQLSSALGPAETLPARPWRSVTFISSDGACVQGWLATPETHGEEYPAIIELHGGPTYAVTDCFSPWSQCWLDHGFTWFNVNYRGSTGFGREFQEKIIGDLGHWEVEDIIAARQFLINEGLARPDRILLMGRSYGGYLTLLTLGKAPNLFAGGIADSAIADFALNDADGSTIRGYFRGLLGGSPDEVPDRYARASASTYLKRVFSPVLLFHGRNDSRSAPRQIETYVEEMKRYGKPIEIVWYDSGHDLGTTDQAIDQQERMLRFAWRVLRFTEPPGHL
ncbi:MAG TPA: prolyl oligopeptidase family serine peptidase [Ktedonobacterales bacterium]|nr:prolyl oligopeptidase family serine peptidase [Ktedonobacterales bacterium]